MPLNTNSIDAAVVDGDLGLLVPRLRRDIAVASKTRDQVRIAKAARMVLSRYDVRAPNADRTEQHNLKAEIARLIGRRHGLTKRRFRRLPAVAKPGRLWLVATSGSRAIGSGERQAQGLALSRFLRALKDRSPKEVRSVSAAAALFRFPDLRPIIQFEHLASIDVILVQGLTKADRAALAAHGLDALDTQGLVCVAAATKKRDSKTYGARPEPQSEFTLSARGNDVFLASIDSGADLRALRLGSRVRKAWTALSQDIVEIDPGTLTDRDWQHFHGTECLSLAAGLASDAELLIASVLERVELDRHGKPTSLTGRKGVRWSLQCGIPALANAIDKIVTYAQSQSRPVVVNMPLALQSNTLEPLVMAHAVKPVATALQNAAFFAPIGGKPAVTFVAAAGNSGWKDPVAFPASSEHVIAVGAHDGARRAWRGSCEASSGSPVHGQLNYHAPGVGLPPLMRGRRVNVGTSFAASLFSGFIACKISAGDGGETYPRLPGGRFAIFPRIRHCEVEGIDARGNGSPF